MDLVSRTPPRAVVVGYDGTELALRAVRWATSFAQSHRAALMVLSAWMPGAVVAQPDLLPVSAPGDGYRRAEEGARYAAAQVGYIGAEGVAVQGRAREVLVAGSSSSRVLVLGTSGHLGLWGLLTAAVARACVRRASCPVVLLGPDAACAPVERVVVPAGLDPDGWSYAWAAYQAGLLGASLVVLEAGASASDDESAELLRQRRWERIRAVTHPSVHVRRVRDPQSWPRALGRRTHPGDLLVVPYEARTVPRLRTISCPVAVLPTRG